MAQPTEQTSASRAAVGRQGAPADEGQAVIALVDDDRNILTSVSIALQAEGFATRVYSDGAAALKALTENPPDLAIFDIKMPRMDGMELLRRLRAISMIPVIFLTSKDDEHDEAAGLAMGADDYIAKPFSQKLLIARIRAILRRSAMAQTDSGEETANGEERGEILRGRLTARSGPAPGILGQQAGLAHGYGVSDPRCAGRAARRDQKSQPADGCGLSRRCVR